MLPGLRTLAPLLLAASTATAPFQCASKIDPGRRFEEEPSEALYALAERFKTIGNEPARLETLQMIVTKYPSSRFAEMAKQDLASLAPAAAPPK